MFLAFSNQVYTNHLIQAFCWTLVHSLWQAIILAIVAGIIILLTRKSKAALRYNLLITSLIIYILGISFSFYIQIESNFPTLLNLETNPILGYTGNISNLNTPANKTRFIGYLTSGITRFCNNYANYIVFVWLLFIIYRSIYLVKGYRSIKKLKTNCLVSAGELWGNRINELCTNLSIQKTVHIFQSQLVKVPMVIGYFKPLILIPIGLLNKLPLEEVEAVVIHELAHIKRNDYIVNLIQHVIEIIFFFNPPLLWVSSLISTERENCCDDVVILNTNSKRSYINALVKFQDYHSAFPQSEMALTQKKTYLLERVKRIIYNHNKSLNVMEKLILSTGLILFTVLGFALNTSSVASKNTKVLSSINSNNLTSLSEKQFATIIDTTKLPLNENIKNEKFTGSISTPVEGKQYKMEIVDNKLTALTIDGLKVSDDKLLDYQATADHKIREFKENMANSNMEEQKAMEAANEYQKQIELNSIPNIKTEEFKALDELNSTRSKTYNEKEFSEMLVQAEKERLNYEKLYAEQDAEREAELSKIPKSNDELAAMADKLKREAEELSTIAGMSDLNTVQSGQFDMAKTLSKLAKIETELALLESEKSRLMASLSNDNIAKSEMQYNKSRMQIDRAKMEREYNRMQREMQKEHSKLTRKQADEIRAEADNIRKQSLKSIKESQNVQRETERLRIESRRLSENIINDLKNEHIILKDNGLSIKLNYKELIVNGIKQSKDLFKKFKEKYVKSKDWNFNYNN